jgi:ABC-type transport system involved in multi-copper enzyme maturation permease subunit
MSTVTADIAASSSRSQPREIAPDAHRGLSFPGLIALEVRKSLDTRAGRWLLIAIVGLAVAVMGWNIYQASTGQAVTFKDFLDTAQTPVVLLLPVIGILGMTSEWSQRSALTTFTLLPRRLPVLLAKLVAALLISVAVMAVLAVATVAATALAGLVGGGVDSWSLTGKEASGMVVTNLLYVLMGVGFGALIPVSGVALSLFFIAPTLFNIFSVAVLQDRGDWLDVFGAFGRIAEFDLAGKGVQSAVAVSVWVLLPTTVGLWASLRREVK